MAVIYKFEWGFLPIRPVFWVEFSFWAWVIIISVLIENRYVVGNDYLEEGYPMHQRWVQSEC